MNVARAAQQYPESVQRQLRAVALDGARCRAYRRGSWRAEFRCHRVKAVPDLADFEVAAPPDRASEIRGNFRRIR